MVIKILKIFFIVLLVFLLPFNSYMLKAETITVFKDSEIENYIKKVASPLLKASGFNINNINFYLVDNNSPNAFVYGGQNIFIFSGLLTFIKSNDELAGVLAHELSHITEAHLLQGETLAKKSKGIILISLLIGSILAAFNPAYLGAILSTFTVVPTISLYNAGLFYSRADEMQADKNAIRILKHTSYSGSGLVNFMNRLQQLEGNPNYSMAWYSTHPLTSTRIDFLKSYLDHSTKQAPCCALQEDLLRVQTKLDAIYLNYAGFYNKHHSNTVVDLYGLAIAELKNSNYEKAETIMKNLVKDNPSDEYFLELLADIYYSMNNFENAYKTYLKVLKHNPDYTIDLKISQSAYIIGTKKMLLEALKYINICIGKNNNSPLALHLKALVLSKLNKPYLANLAIAQKYFYLNNIPLAKEYARKALSGINKSEHEWIIANDILRMSNKIID